MKKRFVRKPTKAPVRILRAQFAGKIIALRGGLAGLGGAEKPEGSAFGRAQCTNAPDLPIAAVAKAPSTSAAGRVLARLTGRLIAAVAGLPCRKEVMSRRDDAKRRLTKKAECCNTAAELRDRNTFALASRRSPVLQPALQLIFRGNSPAAPNCILRQAGCCELEVLPRLLLLLQPSSRCRSARRLPICASCARFERNLCA